MEIYVSSDSVRSGGEECHKQLIQPNSVDAGKAVAVAFQPKKTNAL